MLLSLAEAIFDAIELPSILNFASFTMGLLPFARFDNSRNPPISSSVKLHFIDLYVKLLLILGFNPDSSQQQCWLSKRLPRHTLLVFSKIRIYAPFKLIESPSCRETYSWHVASPENEVDLLPSLSVHARLCGDLHVLVPKQELTMKRMYENVRCTLLCTYFFERTFQVDDLSVTKNNERTLIPFH